MFVDRFVSQAEIFQGVGMCTVFPVGVFLFMFNKAGFEQFVDGAAGGIDPFEFSYGFFDHPGIFHIGKLCVMLRYFPEFKGLAEHVSRFPDPVAGDLISVDITAKDHAVVGHHAQE